MEIKVEKGIPIPAPGNNLGFTQALRDLKNVGDSILLPRSISTASGLIAQMGMQGKFTCRTVEGGVRVWRIKK